MRVTIFFLVLPLLTLLAVTSCSDSESGNARIVVKLTDAPADYQEVNVDIQSVEVHESSSGWITLDNTNSGVYNLLELTDGISAVLADAELPAGRISQIRLVLGDNNSLKMGDQVHDLSTPSGQQSGLKVQLNAELIAGITYEVLLDFDAARSVVEAGNSGKYNLKPVIRAVPEALDGAISGVVLPLDANPVIYAIQGSDTITSAYTQENGEFLLQGLEAGSYTVGVEPNASYTEEILVDIQVDLGIIKDVGTIELVQ